MKRNIEIIIDGQRADLAKDTAVTLNFNSSLLSDIGQLKTDGSQTIKLPRTANNDRIFDMALMPSYESGKTHRYLSCACYVDGITIFDNGRCHLLDSSGDSYEIAMTWGIMHEYSQWISEKKKLTDLNDSRYDTIAWDTTWGSSVWQGGYSETSEDAYSMYAIHYDCGVNDTRRANIHPSVTLQEIWNRIVNENGLRFNLGAALADMRNYAVVLKNNNTSLQTMERELVIQEKPYYIASGLENDEKRIQLNVLNSDFFNVQTSSFIHNGYRKVTVTIGEIYLSLPVVAGVGEGGADFKAAALASPYDYALVIKPANQSVIVVNPSDTLYDNTIVYRVNRTIEVEMSEEDNGKDAVQIYVKIKKWSSLPSGVIYTPNYMANGDIIVDGEIITPEYKNWTMPLRDALKFSRGSDVQYLNSVDYSYESNSNDYPLADFKLVQNLPDISQVDFVKFICQFYGLYAVRNGDAIDFVRMDVLGDNIDNGQFIDWSAKLVTAYADSPLSIGYSLSGFSQRNIIRYKTDENDIVEASASLDVNDATLSAERVMADFPFAASRGSSIPQYSLNEANEVVKKDLQYRIMHIEWNEHDSSLSFDSSMKPQQIINRHYQTLQNLLGKPKTIEEEMTLSLLDIQNLDYSKPIYLSKYGRFYAIDTIQWSSDKLTSKVKLIQIR